jgi:glycosyltransferase involved in cell wall biosynthesis
VTTARVLIVAHRADRSGVPQSVVDVARFGDRLRHRIEAILGEDGPLRRLLEAEDVPVHVADAHAVRGIRGVVAAHRWLGRLRPDLVHVNRAVAFAKSFALAARLRGIPVMWQLHDEFADHRHRARIPWIRRLATTSVACSSAVARQAGLADCAVVPYGTRFDGLPPRDSLRRDAAALGLAASPFRFLFVGMIAPRKNVHVLVEAARRVLDAHPDTDFAAVGGGNWDRYRTSVAIRIAELGLGSRFLLFEERDDVAPFYAASDALVLPSANEAFGRVIVEAAAHGLPTVATAVGGIPDLVVHERTGWLVPAEGLDGASLGKALARVRAADRESVARVGAAARDLLRDRCDVRQYAERIQDLWSSTLARRTPTREAVRST